MFTKHKATFLLLSLSVIRSSHLAHRLCPIRACARCTLRPRFSCLALLFLSNLRLELDLFVRAGMWEHIHVLERNAV